MAKSGKKNRHQQGKNQHQRNRHRSTSSSVEIEDVLEGLDGPELEMLLASELRDRVRDFRKTGETSAPVDVLPEDERIQKMSPEWRDFYRCLMQEFRK